MILPRTGQLARPDGAQQCQTGVVQPGSRRGSGDDDRDRQPDRGNPETRKSQSEE
jgi:hypothetical protein